MGRRQQNYDDRFGSKQARRELNVIFPTSHAPFSIIKCAYSKLFRPSCSRTLLFMQTFVEPSRHRQTRHEDSALQGQLDVSSGADQGRPLHTVSAHNLAPMLMVTEHHLSPHDYGHKSGTFQWICHQNIRFTIPPVSDAQVLSPNAVRTISKYVSNPCILSIPSGCPVTTLCKGIHLWTSSGPVWSPAGTKVR